MTTDNNEVNMVEQANWIHLWTGRPHVFSESGGQNRPTRRGDVKGKYLLFSPNQDRLLICAHEEIRHHEFMEAKVSTDPVAGDYVLCLYWMNDTRDAELRERYPRGTTPRYVRFKADAETMAGNFSRKFLEGGGYDEVMRALMDRRLRALLEPDDEGGQ